MLPLRENGGRFRWLLQLPRPLRFALVKLLVAGWQLLELLIFWAVDTLALAFVSRGKSDAVLIVQHGSLGDYILFRNYLRAVRDHAPFRGKKIVLCGNEAIRELAGFFDAGTVDEFIWVRRSRFHHHLPTRFRQLRQLKRMGAQIVLNPTYSRTWMVEDALVRAAGARETIGFRVPPSEPIWSEKTGLINWRPRWQQQLGDTFYTQLLDAPRNTFEFELYRFFFQTVLPGTALPERPRLEVPAGLIQAPAKPYAVLLPGAGEPIREWPAGNFGLLARHLATRHGLDIVVAGTAADRAKAVEIKTASGQAVRDLTGQLTLPELAAWIAGASLVVANDSGGIHLAAALQRRGIGLSNGNNLLRFHPYPPALCDTVRYVYPPQIRTADSFELFVAKQGLVSRIPAAEIELEQVLDAVEAILREKTAA